MHKITLFTLLFCSILCYSQNDTLQNSTKFSKDWIFKIGVNAIDNAGDWKPFEFLSKESTSAFANPFAVGIEYRFSNSNAISLFGSINKWKANENIIDGLLLAEDRDYAAVDLSYKFYFDHYFFNSNWLDIYLEAGAGLFYEGKTGPFNERTSAISQNLGFGSVFWLSKSIGLNFQSISKFYRIDGKTTSQIQYFAGLSLYLKRRDFDKDGIKNKDDQCPNIYGLMQFDGCPDTDGDGIEDRKDSCPNQTGKPELNGCPDSDNDGIIDAKDHCPEKAGVKENNGCPIPKPKLIEPIKPSEEIISTLNEYAKTILFDYSKSFFKQETYFVLKAITAILKDYPDSNFIIEGHTDSLGSRATNQKLSEDRANAVRDYIISNGIDPARLSAYGFGEDRPKFSNKTKGGRDHNRRVEVKLKN